MGRRAIDISGQRFNHWQVLHAAGYQGHHRTWLCMCDCGDEHVVCGKNLRSGGSKQCSSCANRRYPVGDLISQTFGRWTVLSYVGTKIYSSVLRHMYLCRCTCGKEKKVIDTTLRKGHSVGCGCAHPNRHTGRTPRENNILCSRRRRARKAGCTEHFTTEQFKALGDRCLCCGRSEAELAQRGLMLVPDHVKPLARGGTDDITNIQPLCHRHQSGTDEGCNNIKCAEHIDFRPVHLRSNLWAM